MGKNLLKSITRIIFGQFLAVFPSFSPPCGLGRWFRGQKGLVKNLADMLNENKPQIVPNFLRKIFKISSVWLWEYHRFDLRSPCREQLFFDSTDG
jgi:hypothetical protein